MPKARWLMEPTMPLKKDFSDLRLSFEPLTLYQKFEQVCVLMLTTLIAIIIALALWNLTLKILLSIWATNFDPTDYGVFQTVFGMIFTVIIVLEFKRSLLVVAERRHRVVQAREFVGAPGLVSAARDKHSAPRRRHFLKPFCGPAKQTAFIEAMPNVRR